MSDNKMAIWDAVKTTDPSHTKIVNQRGGFTSISAQYQVQRATETFGPVGVGWGYDVEYDYKALNDQTALIFANVTIWHGKRENKFGPVSGCNPLLSKGRVDDDAPKKAMTDALTKGLSHLGFSADVFLGMYDDNKYVQGVKAQIANTANSEYEAKTNELIKDVESTKSLDELHEIKTKIKTQVEQMPASVSAKVKTAFATQAQSFTQAAE